MVRIVTVGLGLLLLLLTGCGGGVQHGGAEISAKKKVAVQIVTPSCDTTVVCGAQISLRWSSACDSCQVFIGSKRVPAMSDSSAQIDTKLCALGVQSIKVVAWQDGASSETTRRTTILSAAAPQEYGYKVLQAYPHDADAYTQGLLFHAGALYESTGQRGASTVRKVELASGKVTQERALQAAEFGEGLALHGGVLYQLTWTSHKCHKYELEALTPIGELYYSTQGWGLESDGTNLYMTDGTENIYVLNPEDFSVIRTIQAYTNKGPQRMLNELEFIDGLLYANVYLTDEIVAIDLSCGAVVRRVDLSGLLPARERTPHVEVLNGIAHDPESGAIYVTGKYWPKLYHVEFVAK